MDRMENGNVKLIIEGDMFIIPDHIRQLDVENREDNLDLKRCKVLGIHKLNEHGKQFAYHDDLWVRVQLCDRNLLDSDDEERADTAESDWNKNCYFHHDIEVLEEKFRIFDPNFYKYGIWPKWIPVESVSHLKEGHDITFTSYQFPIPKYKETYQIETTLRANQSGRQFRSNKLFGSSFHECIDNLIKVEEVKRGK